MISSLSFEIVPLEEVPLGNAHVLRSEDSPLVMLVDDERLIADTLSSILKRNGFRTQTAYDGASALKLARRTPPDLLITDISMPGMSGVELAVTLSNEQPECKVLLFSAHPGAHEMVANACEDGHKFLFLSKPVHPEVMVMRVSEMMSVA